MLPTYQYREFYSLLHSSSLKSSNLSSLLLTYNVVKLSDLIPQELRLTNKRTIISLKDSPAFGILKITRARCAIRYIIFVLIKPRCATIAIESRGFRVD